MKTFTFFILFSLFSFSQPYEIGSLDVNYFDTNRFGRPINAKIYYPADTSGANVSITNRNTEQFPVIAFGHGYLTTWAAYQNIWEALVPQGYILVFPNTEMSSLPFPQEFAKDLSFLIKTLEDLGSNQASMFYKRIHPRSGVMGHSMGGGSAHLAASSNNQIDVLLSISAGVTTPSPITASSNITIPALLITGSNDCITIPEDSQIPIYNALVNSTCKSFISITGGSHCQMANYNYNCNLGDNSCSPQPTITREVQQQILNQNMILWLDGYLKESCQSKIDFHQNMTTSNSITYQNSCASCALSIEDKFIDKTYFYPNPTNGVITFSKDLVGEFVSFYDLQGKIYSLKMNKNNTLDISHLTAGIYFIKLTTLNGDVLVKKIIKN